MKRTWTLYGICATQIIVIIIIIIIIINPCSKNKRKGEKGKAKKKNSKIEKPKDVGHFLVQKPSK